MLRNKQSIRKIECRLFKRNRLLHYVYSVKHFLAAVCHTGGSRSRLVTRNIVFHLFDFSLLTLVTVRILLGILLVLKQKFVVIAPVFFYHTVFDIDYYFAHAVEKRRIVRYEYKSTFESIEILSQPFYLLEVEEVGRLVEKHYVKLFEKKFCKHKLCSLTAAQMRYDRVVSEIVDAQPVGNFFYLRIQIVKSALVEFFLHSRRAVYHFIELIHILFGSHIGIQLFEFCV